MSAEAVAEAACRVYLALPANGKPVVRDNAKPEWTVLAAVVLVKPADGEARPEAFVASLATGVRCLPRSKLSPHGDLLHDSHAEVLARRGFVIWLAEEILRVNAEKKRRGDLDTASPWVEKDDIRHERFRLRRNVKVCFYISTLPCGDAVIPLLDRQIPLSDQPTASPRFTPSYLLAVSASLPPPHPSSSSSTASSNRPADLVVRGHLGFSLTGVLRTKPGRLDSPPSTSHSCSDKLAAWNVVGLQGGLLSRALEDVMVDEWVVSVPNGGVPEGMSREEINDHLERAIVGRVADRLEGRMRPVISLVSTSFPDSRESVADRCPESSDLVTSNLCISYVPGLPPEVIGPHGAKTGVSTKKTLANGALPPQNRSRLSKIEMMRRCIDLLDQVSASNKSLTYHQLKHHAPSRPPSTTSNSPEGIFSSSYQARKASLRSPGGPLEGWLVHGEPLESFRADGSLVVDPATPA